MSAPKKATGWKVPLLFCAIILGLVALASPWRTQRLAPPPLPQELLEEARKLVIDLDAPDARPWKERIVQAASGFAGREVKGRLLAGLAAEACAAGRLDVACAAGVQVADEAQRDTVFKGIFETAAQACSSLPWAVFAVHGARAPELAASLASALEKRWQVCQGAKSDQAP